jgi:hypothetical protein
MKSGFYEKISRFCRLKNEIIWSKISRLNSEITCAAIEVTSSLQQAFWFFGAY